MKIVVVEPDTKSAPYQVLRITGYVAAVFSLVVTILLIANNLSLRRLDPVHSPALARLMEELKSNPKDEALREEIRELDYLTRRAFFTSQHFTHVGVGLLVGGLAVMVICFKTLNAYTACPAYPDSRDPKEDLAATALWARKSVTAVGLVLVGFALVVSLPWKSPLDEAPVEKSVERAVVESPVVPVVGAGSGAAPVAVAATWASWEERLAQWPGFRGAGAGVSRGGAVPTAWEEGAGAVWKQAVDLRGMNSPVVWQDSVVLSGGDETQRAVYCFDAGSGELRWKRSVTPARLEKKLKVTEDTGYAASTMATDGVRAFAVFADGELVAINLDGTPAWNRSLGVPEVSYGYASSLVAFEDLLIVQMDRKSDSFVAGLDAATGEERWKTGRDFGVSWASPQVFLGPDGPLLVLAASPYLVGYDPRTGRELWRVGCLQDVEVAVSPSYGDGVVYACAEYMSLTAIDVRTREVLWQNEELIPGICTPLVVDGLMFFGLSETGIVCLDAKTGEELWHEETDEVIFASPVLVGENVYMVDQMGGVHIFKVSREGYEAVGAPVVGEEVYASPAVVGNALFIRGVEHLYRFGS
jgi:outer membrane protein assembly factor BamB